MTPLSSYLMLLLFGALAAFVVWNALLVHRRLRALKRQIDAGAQKAARGLDTLYARIEAMQALHAVVKGNDRLLPMPGSAYAASPQLLRILVDEVLNLRPRLVLELGTGVSTIWLGLVLRQLGCGRLISIEHDPQVALRWRSEIDRRGLAEIVVVREAPLRAVDLEGQSWHWYAPEVINDALGLSTVDLLFVDGPPGAPGVLSRFPALPLLERRLSPRAAVILDDTARTEEADIVSRWAASGRWRVDIVEIEKGAAVLRSVSDSPQQPTRPRDRDPQGGA